MSDLRPTVVSIPLRGKEYPMIFNLNAIDEIQTRFGKSLTAVLSDLTDEMNVFRTLRAIITILVNEGIAEKQANGEMLDEKKKSEEWIGRQISPSAKALSALQAKVFEAFDDGMPDSDGDGMDPQMEQLLM